MSDVAMEALKKIRELISAMPIDGKESAGESELPEEGDKEGTAVIIEAGMPEKGGKCPTCGMPMMDKGKM